VAMLETMLYSGRRYFNFYQKYEKVTKKGELAPFSISINFKLSNVKDSYGSCQEVISIKVFKIWSKGT